VQAWVDNPADQSTAGSCADPEGGAKSSKRFEARNSDVIAVAAAAHDHVPSRAGDDSTAPPKRTARAARPSIGSIERRTPTRARVS
jgi:hypothetical protein